MKYRIELTEGQLELVLSAINLMMRTGYGQTSDLTEWLAMNGQGFEFRADAAEDEECYSKYLTISSTIRPILDGVMTGCGILRREEKTKSVLELETIYETIRHQIWLDDGEKITYDVASFPPMKHANEPIPKIERVEE